MLGQTDEAKLQLSTVLNRVSQQPDNDHSARCLWQFNKALYLLANTQTEDSKLLYASTIQTCEQEHTIIRDTIRDLENLLLLFPDNSDAEGIVSMLSSYL